MKPEIPISKTNSMLDVVFKSLVVVIFIMVATKIYNKNSNPMTHVERIREDVGSKTVMLTNRGSGGTGFFVKAPSGLTYILTNAHICRLADSKGNINVTLATNFETIQRRVIQEFKHHDLCLVESVENFEGIVVSDDVTVGESDYIVGHPKLFPLVVSPAQFIGNTVIQIYYGASYKFPVFKQSGLPEYKLFSKRLNPDGGLKGVETLLSSQFVGYSRGGNSGSAIVNINGELVSVLFAGNPSDNQETYAVPLAAIKEFLKYR